MPLITYPPVAPPPYHLLPHLLPLAAIRAALDPEGSKHFYEKQSLPSGTTREYEDGYEIVRVPAKFRDEESLPPRVVLSETMDKHCLKGFHGIKSLNPMQSMVYETAFKTQENLLICAPTGAGKTNVAMLTVLAHFRDKGIITNPDDPYTAYQNVGSSDGQFEKGTKVIYIAPMKALAQEVVEKFSARLKPLSLQVRELTGDMQLTRSEAERTDVIVTTPEKWDVVTRKGEFKTVPQALPSCSCWPSFLTPPPPPHTPHPPQAATAPFPSLAAFLLLTRFTSSPMAEALLLSRWWLGSTAWSNPRSVLFESLVFLRPFRTTTTLPLSFGCMTLAVYSTLDLSIALFPLRSTS